MAGKYIAVISFYQAVRSMKRVNKYGGKKNKEEQVVVDVFSGREKSLSPEAGKSKTNENIAVKEKV